MGNVLYWTRRGFKGRCPPLWVDNAPLYWPSYSSVKGWVTFFTERVRCRSFVLLCGSSQIIDGTPPWMSDRCSSPYEDIGGSILSSSVGGQDPCRSSSRCDCSDDVLLSTRSSGVIICPPLWVGPCRGLVDPESAESLWCHGGLCTSSSNTAPPAPAYQHDQRLITRSDWGPQPSAARHLTCGFWVAIQTAAVFRPDSPGVATRRTPINPKRRFYSPHSRRRFEI